MSLPTAFSVTINIPSLFFRFMHMGIPSSLHVVELKLRTNFMLRNRAGPASKDRNSFLQSITEMTLSCHWNWSNLPSIFELLLKDQPPWCLCVKNFVNTMAALDVIFLEKNNSHRSFSFQGFKPDLGFFKNSIHTLIWNCAHSQESTKELGTVDHEKII